MKFPRQGDGRMVQYLIKIFPFLAFFLLAAGDAEAVNWEARCARNATDGTPICSAVGCGRTAQEAQNHCKSFCPTARITSVGHSSCVPPGDTPPSRPAPSATPGYKWCAHPPPNWDTLDLGPRLDLARLDQQWFGRSLPPQQPGKVINIYCILSDGHGTDGYYRPEHGAFHSPTGADMQSAILSGNLIDGHVSALVQNSDRHTGKNFWFAIEREAGGGVPFKADNKRSGQILTRPALIGLAAIALLAAAGFIWLNRRRRARTESGTNRGKN